MQVYPVKVRNGLLINYTYLVTDTLSNASLIVDPGYEWETITENLFKTGNELKGILLTHHHADHTALAADLARRFDVPVMMSRIEKEFYRFNCVNLQPVAADLPFSVGGFRVIPYHTPGHTKGSVCFRVADYLFTGDTIFAEGCGMCVGEGADPVEMYNSLRKIKACIEPFVRIYPGHSYGTEPGIPFEHLLTENIYFQLDEIKTFVAFRMRKHQKGLFNFK